MNDQIEKFHELLGKFETAILTTQSQNGEIRSRPMAIARVEPNCDLWFLTGIDTEKTEEILSQSVAGVSCQRDREMYLSLSGMATISRDAAKVRSLWKEPYRVWFPEGPEDANLALIHFEAHSGEYWDSSGWNKAKYAFQAIRAYVKGDTPKVDEGSQHGEVQF